MMQGRAGKREAQKCSATRTLMTCGLKSVKRGADNLRAGKGKTPASEKKRAGPFASREKPWTAPRPRASPPERTRSGSPELGSSPESDTSEEELSPYEKQRMHNIETNARIMEGLGITQLADAANRAAAPAKGKSVKKRRHDDGTDGDDDDWSGSDEDEQDVEEEFVSERRSKRSRKQKGAWKRLREPSREEAPKTRGASGALPSPKTGLGPGKTVATKGKLVNLGEEAVGRRVRVSVMTEDTGKNEWHWGELIAWRLRKGTCQHNIRWDSYGEPDEWLTLSEEDYYMYELGEAEDDVAGVHHAGGGVEERPGKFGKLRYGDCVAVESINANEESETEYARLIKYEGQQDGENMWRVHWFYKACNVDEAVRKRASTAIKEDKDLFYSLHEDLLSDETFCGVVKVVAVGSAYRTLLPGEFVCKFVYDVKGDQLHRITDKRLVGKLQKELQAMINPHVHTLSADIEAAVAETGAGSSKGPAMSDSDSAGQSSDEEDAQEERSGLQEEMEAEQTEERHGGKSAAVEWDGGGEDKGGLDNPTGSRGGYLAALEFDKSSKHSSLAWNKMKLAPEERVAECMQKLPRLCTHGQLALLERHKGKFSFWHTVLHAGFNLCFYGFGSKRAVLRDFAMTQLTDGAVVEINGFMPGLKLKAALNTISTSILHEKTTFRSLRAQAAFIAKMVYRARVLAGVEVEDVESEDAFVHGLEGEDDRSDGEGAGGAGDEEDFVDEEGEASAGVANSASIVMDLDHEHDAEQMQVGLEGGNCLRPGVVAGKKPLGGGRWGAGQRELRSLSGDSIYSEREREAQRDRESLVQREARRTNSRAMRAAGDSNPPEAEVRATRGMIAGTSCVGGRAPRELYILIHNAEAAALRQADAQRALALLAAAPGIHLVASVDHVNSALVWQPGLRASFNWIWTDLTTFARYTDESPYVSGSGVFAAEDQMKSALVVLRVSC